MNDMKKFILTFVLMISIITTVSAFTRTLYAYVPNYMYSLGTMTVTCEYSKCSIKFQGEIMNCDVLKKLRTEDGDIYLLHNRRENSYWILVVSSTDGCLFKSNQSFSVRNMIAYLSVKSIRQ